MTLALRAINRFGLGAKPGEAAAVTDPKAYILQQLKDWDSSSANYALKYSMADIEAYQAEVIRRTPFTGAKSVELPNEDANNMHALCSPLRRDGIIRRYEQAVATNQPFPERLMHFWSNHFAAVTLGTNPGQEFQQIRNNMNGYFSDLVIAASPSSSVMQLYLSQQSSYGMNSTLGKGQKGMNENLGREIMELHTIGVNAGYTQDDVIEMAKALTGWSRSGWVVGLDPAPSKRLGAFHFYPEMHEPGARVIMGKTYPDGGEDQVRAIVKDLCVTSACAYFICRKLACHFFGDTPPESMVESLAATWMQTGGYLPDIYAKLVALYFDNPDAMESSKKFRDQFEWAVAIGRSLGDKIPANWSSVMFDSNGFALDRASVWDWDSPAGHSDVKPFVTAGELINRWQQWRYNSKKFSPPLPVVANLAIDTVPLTDITKNTLLSITDPYEYFRTYFTSAEFQWR